MVCGRPHLVRSAVQTMRRRPPSGWAACQLCNDGAQSCEDSPVRALFTGKLGLMTGRAKTKSVRCERFSPGSWNCDAGDATADPVNRLADRVCHAGQSDYSLHLYGHMHIFFVHATVLVGIRRFYHITPQDFRLQRGSPIILSGYSYYSITRCCSEAEGFNTSLPRLNSIFAAAQFGCLSFNDTLVCVLHRSSATLSAGLVLCGNTLFRISVRSSTVGMASTMNIGKDIPLAHVHRCIERLRRAGSQHRQQMWSISPQLIGGK